MKRKEVARFGKKAVAFALAAAMIAQPATGIPFYSAVVVNAEEPGTTADEGVKYVDFNQISQSDDINGETNVQVQYSGTKATITGSDWDPGWGADSKWGIQLKELVPVTAGETYEVSFTITSAVARSIFLKLGDVGNDGTVFKEDEIELEANTPYEYKAETDGEVSIENLMVLFALGQEGAGEEDNTITIENLALKGATSGYVDTTPYINFERVDGEDYIDAATNANVAYTGTTATVTGTDWAAGWGGGEEWGVQLKKLIPVTTGENYEVSFTATSEVARSIVVKLGDAANDETVFLNESIELEAGVPYTYTGTTTQEVDIEELLTVFALGLQGVDDQDNTITITNFSLKGEKSGWVVVKEAVDTSTGKEYDFKNPPEEGDFADPGNTKEGYTLIWADEFDGNYGEGNADEATGLDLSKWAYQLGDGSTDCNNQGWGNKELQCYTGDSKNIAVNEDLNGDDEGDGYLRITASYEDDGYVYGEESSKDYTSARIRTTKATEELFNMTYGYVEARMSLPATKGAWPAFWMLPQSTSIYGGWPVSGEIDIMETCGAFNSGVNDQACSTLHWGAPEHVYKGSGYTSLSSDYTCFHTYAVDWEPGKMTFYYDGVAIYTSENWESGFSGASDTLSFDAPYDQPFYIILNLAVDSGQFGGTANKATFQGDINMYVDYVRAYQRTDGYVDSVERTASGEVKDDWEDYAGINQIAELTADSIAQPLNEDGSMADANADVDKWYLSYQSDATDATIKATTANDTDWAEIGITSKGSQDYSVQLIGHYDAKAGYLYQVSFDAYAEGNMVGKTVNCDSKEWAGWSTYGIQSFTLNSTPTNYSYLVDQTEDFEKCRIEFNLGAQDSGTVYIGNVKVEIVDPSLINRENTRTALADGNLIYNSTFDQGVKHIGYWSASEGTTLEVPRYTTEKLSDTDVSVVDVASKTNYESIADGVKYYERRAQISAEAGTEPEIYQTDLNMPEDSYTLSFDLYSAEDSEVTASIYTVDVTGEGEEQVKTLGTEVLTTGAVAYKTSYGVKTYKWKFDLDEKIENAALVLTFADGASVQVDNVTLIGASQGAEVDPTPMDSDVTWFGDGCEVASQDGVTVASGLTSGTAWYAPQVVSSTYGLTTGNNYKLSFKYKLEGTSNGTGEYIIQENGGSWTVYGDGPTTFTYDAEAADEEGFCSYEVVIPATTTLNNVHMVFGFGNSAASDATFTFKDVEMKVVEATSGGDDDDDNEGAIKIPGNFVISYELNGGVNAESNPTRYTEGVGVDSIAEPTKDGSAFLGWTIGEAGTDYVTSIPTDAEGKIVLVANWKDPIAVPVITAQPSGKTYTVGDTASALEVSATIADKGTLSYQWYKNSTNSTTGAVAISEATGASYTPDITAAGTTYYFCKVTNTNPDANGETTASVDSEIAAVVVNAKVDAKAPTITAQPSGKTYIVGDTASALAVSATAADKGTLSYQWYKNSTNSTTGAVAISGATGASYTPDTAVAGTTYYFCKVTNTNPDATGVTTASVDSNIVAVVVNEKAVEKVDAKAPTITTQPSGKTSVYKAKVTVKVAASSADGGSLSYQWYKNTKNSAAGATAIAGAKSASYTVPTTKIGTTYYFCRVTNTNSKATGSKTATADSKIVKVVVNKAANPITKVSKYSKAVGSKLTLKPAGSATYSVNKAGKKVVTVTKAGKVTFKSIGTATITVKAKGNKYYKAATKKIKITVTPKKATLSSVKSTKSKTAVVKWKKDAKATGYQIQYSTSSKFKSAKSVTVKKNATTTTTIKKLKAGKKYYVRVREYKTVGKTKIYGDWSKTKTVKVKK